MNKLLVKFAKAMDETPEHIQTLAGDLFEQYSIDDWESLAEALAERSCEIDPKLDYAKCESYYYDTLSEIVENA
jgi:hypothetical protein